MVVFRSRVICWLWLLTVDVDVGRSSRSVDCMSDVTMSMVRGGDVVVDSKWKWKLVSILWLSGSAVERSQLS